MSEIIKVLFYARKSKTNSRGLTPIYMRVTSNGQRFESATARFVDFANWSQAAGKVIGNNKEANPTFCFDRKSGNHSTGLAGIQISLLDLTKSDKSHLIPQP